MFQCVYVSAQVVSGGVVEIAGTLASTRPSFLMAISLCSLERCAYRMVMLISRLPDNFHRWQTHPHHHQVTHGCLPEIVNGEAPNPRFSHRPLKRRAEGAIRHALTVAEDPFILIIYELNRF
jgi:hypothetical protein